MNALFPCKALVTTSDTLVTNSFLLLLVRLPFLFPFFFTFLSKKYQTFRPLPSFTFPSVFLFLSFFISLNLAKLAKCACSACGFTEVKMLRFQHIA